MSAAGARLDQVGGLWSQSCLCGCCAAAPPSSAGGLWLLLLLLFLRLSTAASQQVQDATQVVHSDTISAGLDVPTGYDQ